MPRDQWFRGGKKRETIFAVEKAACALFGSAKGDVVRQTFPDAPPQAAARPTHPLLRGCIVVCAQRFGPYVFPSLSAPTYVHYSTAKGNEQNVNNLAWQVTRSVVSYRRHSRESEWLNRQENSAHVSNCVHRTNPDDHTIDADELGAALVGYAQIMWVANWELNKDRSAVRLLVASDFEHKCFNINFELIQTAIDTIRSFLNNKDAVANATNNPFKSRTYRKYRRHGRRRCIRIS